VLQSGYPFSEALRRHCGSDIHDRRNNVIAHVAVHVAVHVALCVAVCVAATKSHSQRHELCRNLSILIVLNVQQTRLYLHYWVKQVSLPYQVQVVIRRTNVP